MADSFSSYQVTYEPLGISTKVIASSTILENAEQCGVKIRSDCGGQGKCGCCRVAVNPKKNLAEITEKERRYLTEEELANGNRLACEAEITGKLRVVIPRESLDSSEVLGKTGIEGVFNTAPSVTRQVHTLNSCNLSSQHPIDFLSLLLERTSTTVSSPDRIDIAALRSISHPSCSQGEITTISHSSKGLTAILPGRKERSLGIAFDIGTTSLAGYLCDLTTGTLLFSASAANPQRRYGEDVVSRIAYANETEAGIKNLQETLIEELNFLTAKCLDKGKFKPESIDEVCVVGNTTMQHIFLGLHPHGLGSSPYLPVSCEAWDIRAGNLGLQLNPGTNVHIFPVVSGFIGGDTVAAILADRTHERDEITLLIDIGTNGELVLGNHKQLWATSCATGPALEGAHINCGMRAVSGAIHKVTIDPVSYKPDLQFIGKDNTVPLGICGSGIIDAVAEMVKVGLILPNGRLCEGLPGVLTDENNIGRQFILAEPSEHDKTRRIFLSLDDIRQVQLAKAALFAGINLLMQRAKIERFDRLVLTGAFGAKFDWANAIQIGMLPELSEGSQVEVVENGAGQGAITALLNGQLRKEKDQIARNIEVLDLSADPDFVLAFTLSTNFPEKYGNPKI